MLTSLEKLFFEPQCI